VGDQQEFFKDTSCTVVEDLELCPEHRGACCDHADPGGVCMDDVAESVCMATAEQPEFFKDATCAQVEGAGLCREHTGACCDHALPGGVCTDNVAESVCEDTAEQPDFFKDAMCAQIEAAQLCLEHTGACCDQALPGGQCVDGVVESACNGVQEFFFKDVTCAEVEALDLCPEHTGACCDKATPGGECVDDVTESECLATREQPQFYKDASCFQVEASGLCPEHTGACCDQRIADPALRCRDNVPQSQCIIDDPTQVSWTKGTLCANLSPPCTEHTGACCDERIADPALRCRDNVPASQCVIDDPTQVSWTKDALCAQVACEEHRGACCVDGFCEDDVPFSECDSDKWFKDTPCDDAEVFAICEAQRGIPTVSEWGLVVLTLLLLTAWKVYFGRRPVTA
jgi:hypothetical protein